VLPSNYQDYIQAYSNKTQYDSLSSDNADTAV